MTVPGASSLIHFSNFYWAIRDVVPCVDACWPESNRGYISIRYVAVSAEVHQCCKLDHHVSIQKRENDVACPGVVTRLPSCHFRQEENVNKKYHHDQEQPTTRAIQNSLHFQFSTCRTHANCQHARVWDLSHGGPETPSLCLFFSCR